MKEPDGTITPAQLATLVAKPWFDCFLMNSQTITQTEAPVKSPKPSPLRSALAATWFALLLFVLSGLHVSGATKPNIVIILADDLGYGDVRCYNPERGKIATPRLDQLASQGMRFTDAHTSSGVCSPTRYALLNRAASRKQIYQSGLSLD